MTRTHSLILTAGIFCLAIFGVGQFIPFWNTWSLVSALLALGFFSLAFHWKSHYYYGVAMLNALVFAMLLFTPNLVGSYAPALLAIVSGVPLIYAGLKG